MDQTPFEHDDLPWLGKSKRSKRSPEHTEDEFSVAEALLLLSNSGGGFSRADSKDQQEAASPDSVLPAAFPKYAHPCWVCGRVFPSHQTLGGHMIGHRVAAASDGNSAAASGGIHECSCCLKRFTSGQALGGHMRKHYQGPPLVRKVENRIAGENNGGGGGGGGGSSKSVVLELDLNLPAPECCGYEEIGGVGF